MKIVRCIVNTETKNNPIAGKFSSDFSLEINKARGLQKKKWVIILPDSESGRAEKINIPIGVKSKVIFFVFHGELGYEILSCHGWLRKLKAEYPELIIGVASRGGAEILYDKAMDLYVDITDLLAKYQSDCFRCTIDETIRNLLGSDKKEIYRRCCEKAKNEGIKEVVQVVYSENPYNQYGLQWGRQDRVQSSVTKDPSRMDIQHWSKLSLDKYVSEKREVYKAFPQLLKNRYVVIHDRRRNISWGNHAKISDRIWLKIINRLKRAGYLVVLLGYTKWKKDDAWSVFAEGKYNDIPGTVNACEFLTKRISRNLIYQAIIISGCDFHLGVWGSAGKIPCLLGKESYMLTADRKRFVQLNENARKWNKYFAQCGGHVHCLESKLDEKSIMDAFEGAKVFVKKKISLKHKVTILIPTHMVPSCPSTRLVDTVFASLQKCQELDGCKCIIGYDMPKEKSIKSKQYLNNLKKINNNYDIEVFGLRDAKQRKIFTELINHCNTEYFLFWEHDWQLRRVPDIGLLVKCMDKYKHMNAVYFSKRDNIDGHKMGTNKEYLMLDESIKEMNLLCTNRWSNNPQLTRRKKWNEWFKLFEGAPLEWVGQKPSKQVEPAIHFKYLDDIKEYGFEKAHKQWGMYTYGNLNDSRMVVHLDGSTFK